MNENTDTPQNDAPLTTEQAADLAALQAMASAEEVKTGQAEEAAQVQASISQVDELTGIIFASGNILAAKFPSLGKVYTEPRSRSVAEAINPVFEKLGWSISGGDFAIYAGALMAVAMLAKDTKDAIKTDVQQMRQEAETAQKVAAGLRPEDHDARN